MAAPSVLDPLEELGAFLGNPHESGSLLSFQKMAHLDSDDAFPREAFLELNRWGIPAYYIPAFVPGGKNSRFDVTLQMARAISRRDLTVAIAHGKTFLGAAPVWIAGTDEQKARIAKVVLSGGQVSIGLTEQAHGSDLVASDARLDVDEAGQARLNGRKWLINNATRSTVLCVYCNLGDARSAGSGRFVLFEKTAESKRYFESHPKIRTQGIRGADISGIEICDAPVRGEDILGEGAHGFDVMLNALQPSRVMCAGFSLGAAELLLRTLLLDEDGASPATQPVLDHGRLREVLADYLLCDVIALVAARYVHLAPKQLSLLSAIAKYHVPETVEKIFETGVQWLGPEVLVAGGRFAHVEKSDRDQKVVGFFDGNSVVNLQQLFVQMPQVCKFILKLHDASPRSDAWLEACASRLRSALRFDRHSPLPGMDYAGFSPHSGGQLDLLAALVFHERVFADSKPSQALVERLEALRSAWRVLEERISRQSGVGNFADAEWFSIGKDACALCTVAALVVAGVVNAGNASHGGLLDEPLVLAIADRFGNRPGWRQALMPIVDAARRRAATHELLSAF